MYTGGTRGSLSLTQEKKKGRKLDWYCNGVGSGPILTNLTFYFCFVYTKKKECGLGKDMIIYMMMIDD